MTPKAKAVLDFMELLLSVGCPMSSVVTATNGWIGAVGLSKRDRKALGDQFFVWQLAGLLQGMGLFGGGR